MKHRDDRWPSAWELLLFVPQGDFVVRVVNVSRTGLRYAGVLPAAVGDPALFEAMEGRVRGRIVRRTPEGGAIRFLAPLDAAQLATLRQYRALVTPAGPPCGVTR